jgi:PAS domain S-box-containing protein
MVIDNNKNQDEINKSAALLNMLEDLNATKDELELKNKKLEETNEKIIEGQTTLLNMTEELKKSNDQISEEKDKINAVLREIGEGVVAVAPDKKIIVWNKAASKITGFSEDEAIGHPIWEVLTCIDKKGNKVDDNNCIFIQAVKIKAPININDLSIKTKTEKTIPIADGISPIFNEKGELTNVVFVFRDISKEKAMDDAKDEFLSIASHQLRTPMTAIKGYLQILISGKVGEMSPKAMEFLQEMNRANERLVKMITDTLDISRIEQERLDVKLESFDINQIIKEDVEELQPLADKKSLTMTQIVRKGLVLAFADPKYTKQVLDNLIGNAIKYTETGKIEIWAERVGDSVVINVEDTGPGISIDDQAKLFQKFFRAVKTSDVGGTGLGLYISKKMAEQMNGKVWVTSEIGKGSTFSFSLPIAK